MCSFRHDLRVVRALANDLIVMQQRQGASRKALPPPPLTPRNRTTPAPLTAAHRRDGTDRCNDVPGPDQTTALELTISPDNRGPAMKPITKLDRLPCSPSPAAPAFADPAQNGEWHTPESLLGAPKYPRRASRASIM